MEVFKKSEHTSAGLSAGLLAGTVVCKGNAHATSEITKKGYVIPMSVVPKTIMASANNVVINDDIRPHTHLGRALGRGRLRYIHVGPVSNKSDFHG